VLAKNPNDGTGGTPNTSAVIKSLGWRLFLDDAEMINGNITQGIEVPGVGKETTIPIDMNLDLLSFLQGQNYDHLMNLAMAIGGKNGSSARVKLAVKPTVDTFLGPITYPGEITVVDKEFRSQ
jgi:LEA14-like dessication related protein